jgi:iron complex transport system substrate-binding protein
MPRIVSLISSATEIVCALGMEGHLVGRSHECDFPPSIRRLPVCTEPKFNVEGSSADIDRGVKEVLQQGLSVYRVHADVLQKLQPDVILTQTQCEVCAVSQRDVEEAVSHWLDGSPEIVSLAPNALADVWTSIRQVADVLEIPQRGQDLVTRLQKRMDAIADRAKSLANRPTVACIEWIEPLMAAGNWMPELVEMAEGENLFGIAGKHAPWLTWEDLSRRNPEVIVVLPCGFDLDRTRCEMQALVERPGWAELGAVCNRRVFVTEANQFFNRPGPRLAESLEILAEILHPQHFHFGHEGAAWQRFQPASSRG